MSRIRDTETYGSQRYTYTTYWKAVLQIHITFMRILIQVFTLTWLQIRLFLKSCGPGSQSGSGFILCGSESSSKWGDFCHICQQLLHGSIVFVSLHRLRFSFRSKLDPAYQNVADPDPQHCKTDFAVITWLMTTSWHLFSPSAITNKILGCLEINEFEVDKSILPGVSCWLAALKASTRHWSCITAGTTGGISSGPSAPVSRTACWYQDILYKCILQAVRNIFEELLNLA